MRENATSPAAPVIQPELLHVNWHISPAGPAMPGAYVVKPGRVTMLQSLGTIKTADLQREFGVEYKTAQRMMHDAGAFARKPKGKLMLWPQQYADYKERLAREAEAEARRLAALN